MNDLVEWPEWPGERQKLLDDISSFAAGLVHDMPEKDRPRLEITLTWPPHERSNSR